MSFRSIGSGLLALLLGCTTAGDDTAVLPGLPPVWTFQQRLPTSSHLRGVRFADANVGYVAGEATSLLKTTDGGATWVQQEHSPLDLGGDVAAMDLGSASVVLAVGADATSGGRWWVTNDGASWTTPSTPQGFATFTSVDVVSTSAAYYLATDGKIRAESAGSAVTRDAGAGTWLALHFLGTTGVGYVAGAGGAIKKTVDDGATWAPPPLGSPTAQTLRDLSLVPTGEGYACGDAGTVVKTANGTDWTDVSIAGGPALRGVHFLDALTGWVVGDGGFVRYTVDGGASWNTPVTTATAENLYDVWFVTSAAGYAVGDHGTVIKTTDGGANWSNLTQGFLTRLNAVDFTRDGRNGLAVGEGGIILRTTDGGATWSYSDSGVGVELYGVSVPRLGGGNIAYACGADRTILKTTDFGATTWTVLTSIPAGVTLRDILFPSSDTQPGYCVGDGTTVLRTNDGGQTWSAQSVPAADYYAIDAPGVGLTAYAAGTGGAVAYTDLLGTIWQSRTVPAGPNLLSIASPPSPNGTTVYAGAANQNVYRSFDAGGLWLAMPVGITPRGLVFTGPSTGWCVGEEVFYLINGATSWSRSYEHTPWTLRGVWMNSSGVGYAVGDKGTILKTVSAGR